MGKRHPSMFASFTMTDEAARHELLADRAQAGLLVTVGDRHRVSTVANLAQFVPGGSVLVLNTSGTFFARFPGAMLPDGRDGTVHFAQMRDESAFMWIVVVPEGLRVGDTIRMPGDAELLLMKPYIIRDVQASWENWGKMWVARFRSPKLCFDGYQRQFGQPIRYKYDTTQWTPDAMQNCFAGRPTSAMMNNGGRNLTPAVLQALLARGVQIAGLEMRTGVGVDHAGIPLPEFVRLDLVNALIINAAIREGRQVIPVGTGVIRALDWFYDGRQVNPGSGWCTNVITPDTGTWLSAWISGMHEPRSTHLAMGAAIMTEPVMRDAMVAAFNAGLKFHENGDTHLYLRHAARRR